jgi:hypothetical protein
MLQSASPWHIWLTMRLILHALALLAMLLAPAGMLGSHSAMAMPHEATATGSDHCEMKQPGSSDEQRQTMIDCAIACSAIPSNEGFEAPASFFNAPDYRAALVPDTHGTRPEAATPPPRFS